jgi:hypothetical protein
MKRGWFTAIFCSILLLFTNLLAVSAAEEIGSLSDKCARGDRKECEKLHSAIWKLTDQAQLARIAVEEKNSNARSAAVRKLTDQALLAKVAVEDKDWMVRLDAVEKLTDQAALAKIAVEDEMPRVRDVATGKITDQATLAKIAIEDKGPFDRGSEVGKIAVRRMTDQTLLAKVAVEAKVVGIRAAAVGNLTDQAQLAKIAVSGKDSGLRSIAISKLTDQALLTKIATEEKDRFVRSMAISVLNEANPALKRLADLDGPSFDETGKSIARMKLAIQEPRIRNHFPGITFAAAVAGEDRPYTGIRGGRVQGESVSFLLSQPQHPLAVMQWRTDFPTLISGALPDFLPAKVHGEKLLEQLLGYAAFTHDDLVGLSLSDIPEVRLAAVANLWDPIALTKIAAEDRDPLVRAAATSKLAQIRDKAK